MTLDGNGWQLTEKGWGALLNEFYGDEFSTGTAFNPVMPPRDNEGIYQQQQSGLGEWDYLEANKGDRLGPIGEKLPPGAESWDPYGRAYYGDGIGGWWNGVWSRLTEQIGETPTWSEEDGLEILDSTTPLLEGDYGTAFSRGFQNLISIVDTFRLQLRNQGQTEGEAPTALAYAGRGVEEVVRGVITAFDGAVKAGKRVLTTPLIAAQELAEKSNLAPLEVPEFDRENWVDTFLGGVAHAAWDVVRANEAKISVQEKWSAFEQAWQASRMGFTATFEDASRKEYIKRLNEGENPALLAMELENPWLELGFELAIDIVSGKIITKISRLMRTRYAIKNAEKIIGATDEAVDILNKVKRAGKIDEGVGFEHAVELRDYLIRSTDEAVQGITKNADELGLTLMVSTGKRAVMEDRVFPIISGVLGGSRNPDEALEIFKAIQKMHSGEERLVTEGIAALKHFKMPDMLLSPGAQELGIFLNNINAEKWLDDLIAITDDQKRIEFIVGKVEGAIENMYPTVQQRIKVADRALAAGKKAEDIPWHIRKIAGAHDKAQKFFQPLNAGLSTVLMRLNPGFHARNYQNNTLTLAVDEGIKAVFMRISRVEDDVLRMAGGVLPPGMGKTFGGPAAAAGAKGGGLANAIELNTGKRVYRFGYQRAINAMEPKAIAHVEDLAKAGFTADEIGLVRSISKQHYGNIDEVSKVLDLIEERGFYELARTLDYIDPGDLNAVDGVMGGGMRESLLDLANQGLDEGKSLDEILQSFEDEIFDGIRAEARKGAREGAFQEVNEHVAKVNAAFSEAENLGDMSAHTTELAGIQKVANMEADRALRRATNEMLRDFKQFIRAEITDPDLQLEAYKTVSGLEQEFAFLLDGEITAGVGKQAGEIIDSAVRYSYSTKVGVTDRAYRIKLVESMGGPKKAWKQFGIPGNPPANLDIRQLYNTYWDEFIRPRTQQLWGFGRDLHKTSADQFVKALQDVGSGFGYNPRSNLWADAVKKYEHAAQFDNAIVFADGSMVFAQGPRARETRKLMLLGQQYGVSGANTADRFQKRLLDTINEFSKGSFGSMDDVPFDVGRKALDDWAQKKGRRLIHIVFQEADEAKAVAGAADETVARATGQIGDTRRVLKAKIADGTELDQQIDALEEILKDAGWEDDLIKTASREFKTKQVVKLEKAGNTENILFTGGGRGGRAMSVAESKTAGIKMSVALKEAGLTRGDYNKLLEPFKEATSAKRAGSTVTQFEDLLPPDVDNGMMPTMQQATLRQMDDYEEMFERLKQGFSEIHGKTGTINLNPKKLEALSEWEAIARNNTIEMRSVADQVATAARDFTLHDYRKRRTIDLAAAYIMPWQFWHTRTYYKWMTKRVIQNPGVIAAYAGLRDFQEKIHAGMPDWWKYQFNTDDLGFTDWDNPLFFNLEASINPLYGLTAENFNDPRKRVNLWTGIMDDAGKYGPSIHPLWNIATALLLSAQGEEDAAARWGGTGLFPQARAFRALDTMFNITDVPGGAQLDPFIHLFSGGMDPYERNRVGRAGYAILEENPDLAAQAYDEFFNEEGEIWDMAIERASTERAWGQIASFTLGVGYRGRTREDMDIDQFDKDWRRLWNMRDTLSDEEFRDAMSAMDEAYPFKDFILLSRKGGTARDVSFAYNVLGRLPPGQSSDVAEAAGIPRELLSAFYDSKGDLDEWAVSDRMRFMSGIVDLGAILELPEDTTKESWDEARKRYRQMQDTITELLSDQSGGKLKKKGEDLWEKADIFYGLFDDTQEGKDAAYAYLAKHPELSQALDMKSALIINDPILSAFYGGIDLIERFYKGQMYNAIEDELGTGIWDMWDEYHSLRDGDRATKDSKKFWNDHPELKRYIEIREDWEDRIKQNVLRVGLRLKEGGSFSFRKDKPDSIGQQITTKELKALQEEQKKQFLLGQIQPILLNLGGSALVQLAQIYAINGEMSETTREAFIEAAQTMGITLTELLDILRGNTALQ